jgi:hypothetical protein
MKRRIMRLVVLAFLSFVAGVLLAVADFYLRSS